MTILLGRYVKKYCILGFHIIPRDTKDNRHSGHVGVPNKKNNQNSFVKITTTGENRQYKNLRLCFVGSKSATL